MSRILVRRFKELEDQLSPLMPLSFGLQVSGLAETKQSVAEDFLLNWSVKAKNIIVKSCGEDSQHFKAFEKAQKRTSFDTTFSTLRRLAAVFLAAKEDFEGGYVKSFKSLIQAEVFDDELEQATELLNSGYQSAAAVIAGTVLESTLRNQCLARNIPLGKMDKMNSDLTKAGVYNSLVQKRITAMAAVRNSAAHSKNTDFTSSDVKSMIDDVRRYIEQHIT